MWPPPLARQGPHGLTILMLGGDGVLACDGDVPASDRQVVEPGDRLPIARAEVGLGIERDEDAVPVELAQVDDLEHDVRWVLAVRDDELDLGTGSDVLVDRVPAVRNDLQEHAAHSIDHELSSSRHSCV